MASLRVVVYGGRGALGSTCIASFKKRGWWVGCIDMAPNEIADLNIIVSPDAAWQEQLDRVSEKVASALGDEKLDAVFCVAGGWAGGNASSKDLVKNSQLMWQQSVWTSIISASLATKHLKSGGIVILPGAKAALEGTSGMVGYGMAKAAVHQLTKSLAGDNSGLPDGASAFAILPVTLDTPMNRKWMPKADFGTWTPLEYIADLFVKWNSEKAERPPNGSLVKLVTNGGQTTLEVE